LQAFLVEYEGIVLRDGKTGHGPAGWYLVRVNPMRSARADLSANLAPYRQSGVLTFSSERGARLTALLMRERLGGRVVSPNLVFHPQSSLEFPDPMEPSGYSDAEKWPSMTEDDDPTMPGDQGLSIGVTHAWRYVDYANGSTWTRPIIAIIDGGFGLDTTTGLPLAGNLDYTGDLTTKPMQFAVNGLFWPETSPLAGGPNPFTCSDGSTCQWHGQEAFSIAAGVPGNKYGTAGTSGRFSIPLLVRSDPSYFALGDAIELAARKGAAVISMSETACESGFLCTVPVLYTWEFLNDAISYATSFFSIVVAAAGNKGIDVSAAKPVPCSLDRVICVGAINTWKNNVFNWGSQVDIWAPTDLPATSVPPSPETPPPYPPYNTFGGTSAAAPFVAGIVALMKTLDPLLSPDAALAALQSTANSSSDPKVTHGYLDAFRAVQAVKPNQPPVVTITSPMPGTAYSWGHPVAFSATVVDPEIATFSGTLSWWSNLDGHLCDGTYCEHTLSVGTHNIQARAADGFGALGVATVAIAVTNRAPFSVEIHAPLTGGTFFVGQTVTFRGDALDYDEPISDAQLTWSSSLSGALGSGREFQAVLPVGTQTVTLRATDSRGAHTEAHITVSVFDMPGFPSAVITAPTTGTMLPAGTAVTLVGIGVDPEEGDLMGTHLAWYSDRDGFLGNGATLTRVLSGSASSCGMRAHTITFFVTDSDGHQASSSVVIFMGTVC
jgi:hypothetical protein